jgi:hypothetical protein
MGIQLEALQACDGDCLLLHYPAGDRSGLVLVDGGPRGVYAKILKKRLEQLRGDSPRLDLRLVMVSHIDSDHVTGILDLCKDLAERRADGEEPRYRIRSLWHNSFESLVGGRVAATESAMVGAALGGTVPAGLHRDVESVVASVKQGNDLRILARTLTTINAETDSDLIKAPESGRRAIPIDESLSFIPLGPAEAELRSLEASWEISKKNGLADEASIAADYLNRTVPNLSSIVILAEITPPAGTAVRILLAGDAGGDLILKGLKTAGLLSDDGKIHLDLLKVQHHGSNHSVDIDFFRNVTADRYVISGNGKHGIPHRDTLDWLSKARAGQECDIYMTNRAGEEGLGEMLDSFLAEESAQEPGHRYHFREEKALSVIIDLPE